MGRANEIGAVWRGSVLALLLGLASPAVGQPGQAVKGPALAHGVFVASPEQPEDVVPEAQLNAYVAAVGRELAYVYLTNNWFRDRAFPAEQVARVRARGATPFIRLMLRSSDEEAVRPDPLFPLQVIIAGQFDDDLRAWGAAAGRVDGPVYAEYGTEVNGSWFAWNARWNGETAGAAQFVQAYRRMAKLVREGGGSNVRWVFHVAAQDDPPVRWNTLESYYPGGDVISVLGVSAYGAQSPLDAPEDLLSLRAQLDDVMPRLSALAPSKPALLLEFGSARGAAVAPEAWAGAALKDLTDGRWPSLRGFSWWDSAWAIDDDPRHDTEMRVETQPALAAIFRRFLVGAGVTERLNLTPSSPQTSSSAQEAP
ncbi:glycosyl hydrolase [Deinococcus marmoris]|uniref:GH26 domain-containing protein n=1 Tax=Deinococcus marmoris TaxID=249408 RepID=A0A1U7NWV3_9DEIO|nr:glycosyl hydrolase [Deinococcus marmoris]OLV17392.1 hypothetical protein BOO71_0008911 [Deinococcus marmoris]